MQEKLIINDINNNIKTNEILQEKELLGEVKKMCFIKYLNLIFAIFRLILLFFLLLLLAYFPTNSRLTDFVVIMLLFNIFIVPIYTIINLITIISGVVHRNFWLNNKILPCKNFFRNVCCPFCCFCSKNVFSMKLVSFFFSIMSFIWSFYFLCYYIKDLKNPNNTKFFPYLEKNLIIKIILYFIDSFLLLGHSYFFHYYQYFLRRREIYIEFYKRLIIKNRNKEAEFVRNELPENNEDSNGTEMQDY